MTGPYINEDGDIWIERGSAPWPAIQHEARQMADEMDGAWTRGSTALRYLGISPAIRVSDHEEYPCTDADGNFRLDCPQCRTIAAHHFRWEEK